MQILFGRSKWDMPELTTREFIVHARNAGFDAVEMHLPSQHESPGEIAGLCTEHSVTLVAMVYTTGTTPAEHTRSLEEQLQSSFRARPALVNAHTGRDLFSLEENLAIFRRAIALSGEAGIPVVHETHRGRPTFSALSTRLILEALPDLRLNADFSHWCCVHESLLQDFPDHLSLAIDHADYIHGRVGYAEGPQITDPRSLEWHNETETHIEWWSSILNTHRQRGTARFIITPEFGPPPYMSVLPFTRQPVSSVDEINTYMMSLLRERFAHY